MRSLGIATLATCTLYFALHVRALIPLKCTEGLDPENPIRCCPVWELNGQPKGECGSDVNRGKCVSVGQRCNLDYTDDVVNVQDTLCGKNLTDERLNWPSRLFSHVCECEGNYGDYDCGGCAYGYSINSNSECVLDYLPRRSITSLSDQDWDGYLKLLQMAKEEPSTRYGVLTDQEPYYTETTMYNLFIWLHHYATKDHLDDYKDTDSACDYAHESTGFLTWHRILLLWLERELQILSANPSFRISYWDWTNGQKRSDQLELLFSDKILGEYDDKSSIVTGKYIDSSSWDTICLAKCNGKCNPHETGPSLMRCPNETYCNPEFKEWPSRKDIETALNFKSFGNSEKHNKYAKNVFRTFVEGFEQKTGFCGDTILCNCDRRSKVNFARKLHNSVHIILGVNGTLRKDNTCKMQDDASPCDSLSEEDGAMADVRASPNDPVFIHHHAMIDLIFEMWLQKYPSESYGGPPSNSKFPGHAANDCAVPFMPVFTHLEAFKTADTFGYYYEPLEDDTTTTNTPTTDSTSSSMIMVSVPLILTGIVLALITILA